MGQCADFLATDVGVAGLCRINSGDDKGVITYSNGAVAVMTDHNPGQPDGFYIQPDPADKDRTPIRLDLSATVIARMKDRQDDQFVDCSAQGFGSKFSFTTLSSSMDWPTSTKSDIRRLVWGSNAGGRPNLVVTCSDATYQGLTGINNSPANHQLYVDALKSLDNSCGAFDGAHCEALRQSVRGAAGLPTPVSSSVLMEILKIGGGLLGVALAFGVVVPWLQKWLGPKDGGHGGGPNRPTGGGDGKGPKEISEAELKEKIAASKNVSFKGEYVVIDKQAYKVPKGFKIDGVTGDNAVTPPPVEREEPYKLFLETEKLTEKSTAWDVVVRLRDSKHHPKLLKELMGLMRDPQFSDYTPLEQSELAQRLVKAHVTETNAQKRPEWHVVEKAFHGEVQGRKAATEKRTQDVTKVERRVEDQRRKDEERKEERRIVP